MFNLYIIKQQKERENNDTNNNLYIITNYFNN